MFGSYHLITLDEGKFVSKAVVALGWTERPSMAELQNYSAALGSPGRGVEFALFWTADDDPEMVEPVFVASLPVTMRWADYQLSRSSGQSFLDYLNQVSTVLATGESEEDVSVDIMRYMVNRIDMSPHESVNLIVKPPDASSVEYQELISRPGEIFMLLLYVEKHLSYHFVSRHPDIISLFLVLQPQIEGEAAFVMAETGSGLMAPPPSGPLQYRFRLGSGLPDQAVQQPAHLGNRQRYQGFIPL